MHPGIVARRSTYSGLFLVTLATLMYEILLTRVFSVTMWYHFAFLAVSAAMFGMTVGAMVVYLLPNLFPERRINLNLATSSLLFAVTIVLSFAAHLRIHFAQPQTLRDAASLALTYLVVSLPFVFSGTCVCLALTGFPSQVNRLYAADLAGAGLGCIVLIYALKATDAPAAIVMAAFLASLGGVLFSWGSSWRVRSVALATCLSLAPLALFQAGVLGEHRDSFFSGLLQIRWVKGQEEPPLAYERWNSFSRVTVAGDPETPVEPFGWGLSATYAGGRKVKQLYINIDAGAGTVLTSFDGSVTELDYLKYEVTNIAHYLRRDANVLVVGAGGGRDILSALVFAQRSVVGVEINENIISAVNRRFGDFTRHLDRYPNVTFVNDEARSYIARQKSQYGIIQISLIDTWAATAAGALALTENSLYTVEAWKSFLDHLARGGLVSVSRWYPSGHPTEFYRLASLAAASLAEWGARDPGRHIIIVRHKQHERNVANGLGIGTLLMSRDPFSDDDIQRIEHIADQMRFEVVLTPRFSADSTYTTLASGKYSDPSITALTVDLSPPTDDRPFFFNAVGIGELANAAVWRPGGHLTGAIGAVVLLAVLLGIVLFLTLVSIVIPLFLKTGRGALKRSAPLTVFFLSIGLGFMLIEISQMQRLIIFLGHPTYALSVVLFALLLSSGLGSYLSQRLWDSPQRRRAALALALPFVALLGFGQLTPHIVRLFAASSTSLRVAIAAGVLFPIGIFMGAPFPLGMRLASERAPSLAAWLWGINGAASVCGSLLAVAIGLYGGISAAFWIGSACYAGALISFLRAARAPAIESVPETVSAGAPARLD